VISVGVDGEEKQEKERVELFDRGAEAQMTKETRRRMSSRLRSISNRFLLLSISTHQRHARGDDGSLSGVVEFANETSLKVPIGKLDIKQPRGDLHGKP